MFSYTKSSRHIHVLIYNLSSRYFDNWKGYKSVFWREEDHKGALDIFFSSDI